MGTDGSTTTPMEPEQIGEAAVDLAARLIGIDTVNPGLVAGAAGERVAVDVLAERLAAAGFECEVLAPPHAPGRPSLLASRSGGSGRRHLLLNGHLDTVGTEGMADPFEPRIEGDRHAGRLHGRGACDMKAGVAGLVTAAEAAARHVPDLPITLALVADEEDESIGTTTVLEHLRRRGPLPDACLVGEPTWLDLAVAHRGFAVVDIHLRGRTAHSSRPEEGVNAVAHLGRLLVAIEERQDELDARPPHPLLGQGSAMATVASGGTAPFTVAARASATYERRTLPGESTAGVLGEVHEILVSLHATDPTVDASATLRVARDAWEQDDSPASTDLARLLTKELTAAGAKAPDRVGAPYWMESALWQAAGIPTVVCGPAGGGLHAAVEWVELAQLRVYAVALARVVTRFG